MSDKLNSNYLIFLSGILGVITSLYLIKSRHNKKKKENLLNNKSNTFYLDEKIEKNSISSSRTVS